MATKVSFGKFAPLYAPGMVMHATKIADIEAIPFPDDYSKADIVNEVAMKMGGKSKANIHLLKSLKFYRV
jgi:hypothetical protein